MVGHDVATLGSADVLVVGSGAAGSAAAIAAARTGASVILVEKLPFLGGNSTAVLDTFYGFFTPGEHAHKVVGGIGDEVVAGLERRGRVVRRPNTYGAGTGITYNPQQLKLVWEELVTAAGVRVLLHCFVQDVFVTDGRVTGVLVATKSGLRRIEAAVVVDASGDADVCHYAGFGYERAGELEPSQTLTTTFQMVGVDWTQRKTIDKQRLHELMGQAYERGYALPRREGSDHVTPLDGVSATVMTRLDAVVERDGHLVGIEDPDFLTRAEIEGRRQAAEYARFLRDFVPGYADAELYGFSAQIGIRETRRVYGDYRLTRSDVLSARQFDDQVGQCGAPIEDHHAGTGTHWAYLPEGATVGIPARTLIVRDAVNTLVAGRCFSASHDAHASVRSMGQVMAMGQAAGTLAGQAVADGGDVRAVSYSRLEKALRDGGAVLDSPAA
ncbi:MAG: FAD-dependent oxidoreductase [Propionicimonas sp.]|uniref:FAD-dependent oxidoreductase n=1 Tax=Propionicimonas sp. TaxID=1955623 RepID=UPI002B20B3B2|nr:FAD-dependent oxidoreductase [Propionicimonas sp.]MEA4943308.1 FAD-dependent oxidoreductase [Propionicimonas sp.]MEA5054407.1 FAD-dependent oxidoreductase [Propionicimonas sp.]MEA5117840.1 FAD-dependent oxidoreductase [Propionicimonas sp.]